MHTAQEYCSQLIFRSHGAPKPLIHFLFNVSAINVTKITPPYLAMLSYVARGLIRQDASGTLRENLLRYLKDDFAESLPGGYDPAWGGIGRETPRLNPTQALRYLYWGRAHPSIRNISPTAPPKDRLISALMPAMARGAHRRSPSSRFREKAARMRGARPALSRK